MVVVEGLVEVEVLLLLLLLLGGVVGVVVSCWEIDIILTFIFIFVNCRIYYGIVVPLLD